MLDAAGIFPSPEAANTSACPGTPAAASQRHRSSCSPLPVTSEGQLSPPESTAKVTAAQMMPNRTTTAAIASHGARGGLID